MPLRLLTLTMRLIAIAMLALLPVAGPLSLLQARAQSGQCVLGTDCCVVGMSMSRPHSYAVICDPTSAGQTNNPIVVFGPVTFQYAGAWMALAGIPGWGQYSGISLGTNVIPPQPDPECTYGQNCCYVGGSWDEEPRYAIAYDDALATGSQILAEHDYPSIIFGPGSAAYCHAWWNANIASAGLGEYFPTDLPGVVPFSTGAGAGAGPLRAPPPAGPSGPQGPASAGLRSGISVALNTNAWIRVEQFVGAVSGTGEGLLIGGGPWTNGQLRDGAYDGNYLRSREVFDLGGGGDVYVAVMVEAGGRYLALFPRIMPGVSGSMLTTHNTWSGSILIPERAWIFLHLRVEPGGSFRLAVARSAYDDQGGEVMLSSSGTLPQTAGPLELRFVDNYAGEAAQVLVGEAWVYPGGGQNAGGGSCSRDADCPGSICLLGVCAPPIP